MYEILKTLHAIIGVTALLTFWGAGIARKGTQAHRLVGRTYLVAMCGILATGFPMAAFAIRAGHEVTGTFLAYLLLITATAMWQAWRAIRDKHDYSAYTGRMYRVLMVANAVGGLGVLALGLTIQNVLLSGFSFIGIVAAWQMFQGIRRGPAHTLWWREAHMDAMLGNAIATHIAFLSIGLPKLLPMLAGPVLQNLAWFGPIAAVLVVRRFLVRRFPNGRPIAPEATSVRKHAGVPAQGT